MPRETDPFREHVKFLSKTTWNCNFCGNQYAGSATRIKAHLAGVGGYGIHGCKVVDGGVRSEAQKALKGKGLVESSSGSEGNVQGSSDPRLISPSLTQGPHQPVTVGNEDAWRDTSFPAMPNLSSNAISTVGASSSAFLPLHGTNVPSQSLPAQNMIPQRDFSFWPPLPQFHADDSYIQPPNLSFPSSGRDLAPEALTNMPGPVNAEEGEPNTEGPQDARTDDALVDSRRCTCKLVHENMPTPERKLEELSNQEADVYELETLGRKGKRRKGEYWSMVQAFREGRSLCPQQVIRVNNLSKEVEEILGHCRFQNGSMTHAAGCRKSSPLVTTELVGKESEETIEKICDYLMEDETFTIGIWGMGGVGKTAILMHVHNIILENPAFNNVFWVTAPQEFSVYKLQDEIANVLRLHNLSKDKDVKRRAGILNRHLKKKKRAVLILDGLWMHFDVEDVGIPVEKGGIKLVLTTQSLDVCHKMLCQKQMKIEPLCREADCRSLFLKKLCFGRELPSEVKTIASSILDKCGGLPLGIIEIATQMRGVEEVRKWKGMLQKFKDLTVKLDVFERLKLSYVNLRDSQVQQCFLHLTQVFLESKKSPLHKTEVIESFIDECLLDGIGTRQELHEQVNTILDKLRKGCLCDTVEEEYLYLHPLIRDMALHLVSSTTHMVKAYMELEEIPEEKFWTKRLEKAFLQGNEIEEIPDGISPNCPKLTRLSLNDNRSLKAIHESFFKHLKGLKVLDLSYTGLEELPDAISHLESLEALLLQGCQALRRIPCVRKLGSLRKLDLNRCAMLEELPEGMEMLVELRYLDLRDTKIETLPEGVLGKLVNLRFLMIKTMMPREDKVLKKVEGLYCSVPDVETFNACVRFLRQNSSRPYELALNVSKHYSFRDLYERHIIIGSCHSIAARADGEIGGDGRALLPENVQVLNVGRCGGVTSLCELGPLENLEELEIEEWEKLEELGAVHFPQLRRMNISGCSKLKHLLEEGQGLPRLHRLFISWSEELEGINIAAPFLYGIEVRGCPKMKRVVEWVGLATRLPNLRTIEISDCDKLEEIIGAPVPIDATCLLRKIRIYKCNNMKGVLLTRDMLRHLPYLQEIIVEDCKGIEVIIGTIPNTTHSSFPYLTDMTLRNLPGLKSICDETVSCYFLRSITIEECPKLKRIPLLDNKLPSPPFSLEEIHIDRQTWESLEWDHPSARTSVEHLVTFDGKVIRPDQRLNRTIESCDSITAMVDGEVGGDGRNLLPKNVQVLKVGRGSGVTSLSEVGPLENLEELQIKEWEKLEELGAVHFPQLRRMYISGCSKLKHLLEEGQWLRNLRTIKIDKCEKLEEIIGGPLPATCFLTKLEINGCNNMKGVLLTHDMLLHLPFLQDISVRECEGIEVIIGTVAKTTHCSFSKLTKLTLWNLPELKSICDWTVSCDSLQWISIEKCPKLKRIPVQLRPLDNGLHSPPPSLRWIRIERQTWQALEWDHPLARSLLKPFAKFF